MNYVKLAAIDIGSNSIRLLIMNIIPTDTYTYYRKVSMTRLPVRLGADVFTTGKISDANAQRLVDAMRAYSYVMKVNGIQGFRACATSAMREAKNGAKLVKKIAKATGINIEIISGEEEARLIFASKMFDVINPTEKNFVYIDVGGGSTELTIWENGEIVNSKSFKVGTVRLLNNLVNPDDWSEMESWVKLSTAHITDLAMIGSGGNINKTHKMSGKKMGEPLSIKYLSTQLKKISKLTPDQRVTELGLNFDRADVIVHALTIYTSVSKWVGAQKIYVPKIGVSDGIVRDLYHRDFKSQYEHE